MSSIYHACYWTFAIVACCYMQYTIAEYDMCTNCTHHAYHVSRHQSADKSKLIPNDSIQNTVLGTSLATGWAVSAFIHPFDASFARTCRPQIVATHVIRAMG